MPKVSGVFEIFKDLDLIPLEDITKRVANLSSEPRGVENYIANLILYPQIAPVRQEDLKLDLAILTEALRRDPRFYNQVAKKIIIPESFVERFGDLKQVILAYLDAYKAADVTLVVLSKDNREEPIGSVVTPLFNKKAAQFEFEVEGKSNKFKSGNIIFIPCDKQRCHISFKSEDATLINRKDITVESFGGILGIVADARESQT